MMFGVHVELRVTGPDDFAAEFERLIDAYFDLEQACPELLDSSFALTLHDGYARVDAEVTVDAVSDDEALHVGSSSIRTAIQTIGGHTPGWGERPTGVSYRVADEDVAPIPA